MVSQSKLELEVLKAIKRVIKNHDDNRFATKTLSKEELENIKTECGSNIDNIGSRINKIFHKFKEKGILDIEPGGYCVYLEDGNEEYTQRLFNTDKEEPEIDLKNEEIENNINSEKEDEKRFLSILKSNDSKKITEFVMSIKEENKEEIFKRSSLTDYIIDEMLLEENGLEKDKIYWLINKSDELRTYYENRLLNRLNFDDKETRKNALKLLRNFDFSADSEVFIIEKLKDEEFDIRLSALKTLVDQNKIKNKNKIFTVLESWKEDFQIREKSKKDQEEELDTKKVDTQEQIDEKKSKIERELQEKRLSWREAVKQSIRNLVERQNDPKFTRQNLIEYELDNIVDKTDSDGKTPEEKLKKILKELREEEKFISYEGKGLYKLQNLDDVKISKKSETKEKSKTQKDSNEKETEIDINNLIENLKHENKEKRERSRERIIELCNKDDEIERTIIDKIDDLPWKYRYKMVEILKEIESESSILKITDLIDDPNEWVRDKTAQELGDCKKQIVVSEMIKKLKSDKSRTRTYAIEVLVKFDEKGILYLIQDYLEDNSIDVRKEVLNILEKSERRESEKILEKAKEKSKYSDVSQSAKSILRKRRLDRRINEMSKKTNENDEDKDKSKEKNVSKDKESKLEKEKISKKSEKQKIKVLENQDKILLFYDPGRNQDNIQGWQNDEHFVFIGEEAKSNEKFSNKSFKIKNHKEEGKELHLYKQYENGKVEYDDQVVLDDYRVKRFVKNNGERMKRVVFKLIPKNKFNNEEKTSKEEGEKTRKENRGNGENNNFIKDMKNEFDLN